MTDEHRDPARYGTLMAALEAAVAQCAGGEHSTAYCTLFDATDDAAERCGMAISPRRSSHPPTQQRTLWTLLQMVAATAQEPSS